MSPPLPPSDGPQQAADANAASTIESARPQRLAPWAVAACGLLLLCFVSFRLSLLDEFMVHVDDYVPMAEMLRQHANPWYWPDVVHLSGSYTYPPGQFFISLPLTSFTTDFSSALFLYRLPSLLFWLLGFWVFHRVLCELWPEASAATSLLPVAIGLLSWRGFVESSQGYNYATTTLVTAGITWFVGTERGRYWLGRQATTAFAGGLLFGLSCWLTYQAMFVVAAALGALAVHYFIRRNFRMFGMACVTGVGFTVPFAAVGLLCLRPAMRWASGTPAWAGGLPGPGWDRLLFPFRAWFEVLQNNLTFVSWGWGSRLIAVIAATVIALGLFRLLRDTARRRQFEPLLLFLLFLGLGFSTGPFLHLFPLGSTRHSFILQIPLLLLLALALAEIQPRRAWSATAFAMLGIGWLLSAPRELAAVRNHVDYDLLARHFSEGPDTRITDLPGACTWEISYLARTDIAHLDRIRWFIQFPNTQEQAEWVMDAPRALLVSHRGPLSPDFRQQLEAAGARKLTTLAEITPGRGTELRGLINGGNGFFLYLVER